MKQHHNGCWETSKSTLSRKKQLALALAVSLWIASGGVASASVYIDVTDNDTVKAYGSSGSVEPDIGTSNVKKLTASGNWDGGGASGRQGKRGRSHQRLHHDRRARRDP